MKKTLITMLFAVTASAVWAQSSNIPEDFSDTYQAITSYETSMTEYAKDPDAEALVVYEKGNYYFIGVDNEGFVLQMQYTIKIKILKEAGLKYAKFEIPYRQESRHLERIEKIEGTTYNVSGGHYTNTKLASSNIFEEKISDNVFVKKIAMPDVRVGSVIELKYHISTPFYFSIRPWEYQKTIPVRYSQLKYRAIPYLEYTYIMKGSNKFDEFDSKRMNDEIQFNQMRYNEVEYTFGMKDLPAFRDEEFVSSPKDYMISQNFQLSKSYSAFGAVRTYMTTWPEMNKDFLKDDNFGKYINNAQKEAKKILPTLNLEGKSQEEQIKTITNYVKMGYNWDGYTGKYSTQKVSDLLKRKTGNIADLNLFLIGLLNGANIPAEPIVLSTRSNGVINKMYPFQNFFNYVIVKVDFDGKTHFLDASESLLAFNELPTRCTNVEGLIVKEKSENWITTFQEDLAETVKSFKIKLSSDLNNMEVQARYSARGNDAYVYKAKYLGKIEDLTDYIKKDMKVNVKGDVTASDLNNNDEPFVFSFNFDFPVENTGDKIFINPFCNLSITDNPFKQTKRTLPVDLGLVRGEMYYAEIDIPDGYKLEYIPTEIKQDGKQILVVYSIPSRDENKIKLAAQYQFKSNIFDAKDYLPLKVSMGEAIKKFSDMIVLVKK